jgi:hypothetical protein
VFLFQPHTNQTGRRARLREGQSAFENVGGSIPLLSVATAVATLLVCLGVGVIVTFCVLFGRVPLSYGCLALPFFVLSSKALSRL